MNYLLFILLHRPVFYLFYYFVFVWNVSDLTFMLISGGWKRQFRFSCLSIMYSSSKSSKKWTFDDIVYRLSCVCKFYMQREDYTTTHTETHTNVSIFTIKLIFALALWNQKIYKEMNRKVENYGTPSNHGALTLHALCNKKTTFWLLISFCGYGSMDKIWYFHWPLSSYGSLWKQLKKKKIGQKNHRRHPINAEIFNLKLFQEKSPTTSISISRSYVNFSKCPKTIS